MGIGSQNAYIVKRKGVQFSRDPLNLVNLHSRKHSGFVNTKVCAHTLLLTTPRIYERRRRYREMNELILMRNPGCRHRTR